jgi:hypothetical protein
MRVLLKARLDTEMANRHIQQGTLGPLMKSVMEELKPEAAYFGIENGKRTAYIVLNMQEPSELPRIAEPFFLALGAEIDVTPVMVSEDLGKAMAGIEGLAKKYGAK